MIKITLTFNEPEYEKDVQNRFETFFSRVLADIYCQNTTLCGEYEKETAQYLRQKFSEGKVTHE